MTIAEHPPPDYADPADRPPPGRLPPQDVAAEQSVLGSMLLSKDAIADVVETVKGADFYRPAHELVYDAIIDLYGRGEPADALTAKAVLERRGDLTKVGGPTYLTDLIAMVPSAANAGYYAEIVREKSVLRKLVEAGTRITQIGYAADGEIDSIVDRAQAEIYAVTDRRSTEDYRPLSEIMESTLDEIEAIGARDGSMVGVPTGFTDMDALTNGLHPGQMVIVAARPGMGKALALETPLPTPTGWKTMGEVQPGDQLLGADGRPTRVLATSDVMTDRSCYEVRFSDGSSIVADGQHQWLTEARQDPVRSRGVRPVVAARTTAELARTIRCATAEGRINHAIRNTAPLQLPERKLPLAPYALGAWLGDGSSACARITTVDPEIVMYLEACGLQLTPQSKMTYGMAWPISEPPAERTCILCGVRFVPKAAQMRTCGRGCDGRARFVSAPVGAPHCPDCGGPYSGTGQRCRRCHADHGSVHATLRSLGVLGAKHIPPDYLRASENQRRALLAGILDTDGTVTNAGAVQVTVTSRRLADDIYELLVGLGYRCSVRTRKVRGRTAESSVAYRLKFSTSADVFALPRKAQLHKELRASIDVRSSKRYVTDVRQVPSVPVRCVRVDNDDHLYLAGRAMVPTHNSALALDFARAASVQNGLASVIFSLEMSRTEITMRLLSAEARVPMHHMRQGTMTDDDWARLARRMGEVSSAPMYIDDSPNMTMMEIRAKARRLRQRHDLRLILVDYLQLMSSGKKVESRQVEVSEFSRNLKLLAKELEVPVVALAQLNRGPEQRTDKRPMTSDLRESGSLEQDADMVILLHREDAYERESARPGEADLIVAKHRNGPTATVTVAFQGHYSRFVDMAQG